MYKIKTLNKISKTGLKKLNPEKYVYGDDVENPDGILVRSASLHEYPLNPELMCISRAGAGVNNIPIEKCSGNGIVVFNTPGANANAVKELVICALLLASRRIYEGISWVNTLADKGDEVQKLIEKGKSSYVGPELAGKRLGVIGLGAIGVMVANAASKLDMQVLGYDPYISVDAAWGLSRSVLHATDLKSIYETCDYITLHVPVTDETRNMINADTLAIMKKGVRIINLARNELVNDDDILEALNSGKVSRYVTDFPDAKLIGAENVIAIPHLGASTPESEENCAEMAVRELVNFIEKGIISNSVNFPDMDMPREGKYRVCTLHKNIPKMVSGIVNIFGEENINIEDMLNRAKRDYACTLIDMNVEPAKDLIEKIKKIPGVIRVRIIK